MFAFQRLGKALAGLMLSWVQMAVIRPPAIGEEVPDSERLQQPFQGQKGLVFPTPEDIGQDGSSPMVQGLPQPPLCFLLTDKGTPLVYLSFLDTGHNHGAVRVR